MEKKMQFLFIITVCLAFTILAVLSGTAWGSNSSQVDKYIEMLSSDSSVIRKDAAKSIFNSGVTDPRISDKIHEILIQNYQADNMNRHYTEEMSWMCKALSVSGSNKYKPVLFNIVETTKSNKLKKYAKQSINLLSRFVQVDSSDNSEKDYALTSNEVVNRYIKMLRSNNTMQKREAAKSVAFGYYTEKELYDTIQDELLKGYMHTSMDDRYFTDALGWMCKALGASRKSEYKKALAEVVEKSHSMRLQKHARQALEKLK